MDYVLTFDLGTTHIKALAFDLSLKVLYEEEIKITTSSPHEYFQEQDPDQILESCQQLLENLINRLSSNGLKAIVFSNAMHSVLPVDIKGSPNYPAVIWSDLRASELSKRIGKTNEAKSLYKETGTPIHPMSPLFKILWFREIQPKIFKKTEMFLSIKEYLIFKWFGEYLTDYSTASATGLFDIYSLDWNKTALNIAGITSSKLPQCVSVDHCLKAGNSSFMKNLKIPENVPVMIGATDGCLAVLGAGNQNIHKLSLTIGTSAALRIARSHPVLDPESRVFNYFLEKDTYISGGPSNNGGNLLEWSARLFMKESDSISFSVRWADLIKRTIVDNSGIIFVPYIFGERAPIWQPEATGSFHGIKHYHSPDNFARATVEGMLMNLRTIVEIVDPDPNTQVILSGGVFKIEGLAQLCSDIFNRSVKILNHTNLSARGAALLAWKFFGTQIETSEVDSKEYTPDLKNSEIYSSQFTKFKALLSSYLLQIMI